MNADRKLHDLMFEKIDVLRRDGHGNLVRQPDCNKVRMKVSGVAMRRVQRELGQGGKVRWWRKQSKSAAVQVICRKETDTVKREPMLGYPLKEMGNAWCQTIFKHNMSQARMRECRDAHAAVVGYNVFKRRSLLLPTGWMDVVIKYEQLNCYPLCYMMHTVHVVRFMLLDGRHAFSPKWLDATGGSAVDQKATAAFRRIVIMLRMQLQHVYVSDVFDVMNRGREIKANKESYDRRDQDYDSMSIGDMKLANRAAKNILQQWQAHNRDQTERLDYDLAEIQMPIFTANDIEAEIARMGAEGEAQHPAAGFNGVLEEEQAPMEVGGELMDAEEEAIVFAQHDPEEEPAEPERMGDVGNRLQDLDMNADE